jgi:hypothetical protein
MIPASGSINVLSTTTLGTTALAGNLTVQFSNATTTPNFRNARELIVTGGASAAGVIAATLAGLVTSPFLFIKGITGIPTGARIIAKESPKTYAVTFISWGSGVLRTDVSVVAPNVALPVACVVGQKVTISGSGVPALNGTWLVTGASNSTTRIDLAIATDPGIPDLTLFSGLAKPGIVDSAPDGTGSKGFGYYTINMDVTAASAGITGTTPCWTPFVLPASTTHVVPTAGTATLTFADLILDGVGSVTLPCLDIVCFKNLFAGSYVMANGSAATDVSKLVFCTLNVIGRN